MSTSSTPFDGAAPLEAARSGDEDPRTSAPAPAVGDDDQRIHPAAALRPGRRDPLQLITIWLVRKSAYWLAGLASVLAALQHQREVSWGFDSPAAILALLVVVVRFAPNRIGLAMAYPVTMRYEADLVPRTGLTAPIGKWLDRRQIAKAMRTFRFTHHVRQAALDRLGATGDRLRRTETVIDVTNVVAIVAGALALMFVAGPS